MDYGAFIKREYPNPSRRSVHHVRQSPFRGSNREVRGMLLKTLLERPGMTTLELATCLDKDAYLVEKNLRQLHSEGFLVMQAKRFFIT